MAAASGPRIVRDVVPGPAGLGQPGVVAVLGSTMLFAADADDGRGRELWKTDGTRAGTRLVRDINQGAAGSSPGLASLLMRGRAYFNASTASNGSELWRSDGTSSGTRLVKDIAPSGEDSLAFPWAVMDGRVYLSASDGDLVGDHGLELWRTNGSSSGTRLVRDINTGEAPSGVNKVASIGDRVLFIANDGSSDLELFVSDGTRAGTRLLRDINEEGGIIGYPGGGPLPAVLRGVYYFGADDGTSGDAGDHGAELWRSDGTRAGTRLVRDINPGTASSSIEWLRVVGGKLFFAAQDARGSELWVSDGTRNGTRRVKDVNAGPGSSNPYPLGAHRGILYFGADDGAGGHGRELWRTDGSAAGTRMVKDIRRGGGDSAPRDLAVVGGSLYFSAENAKGRELWRSDGTKRGTTLVSDLASGPASSSPEWLTRVGTKLVFFADDGIAGLEPWVYIP